MRRARGQVLTAYLVTGLALLSSPPARGTGCNLLSPPCPNGPSQSDDCAGGCGNSVTLSHASGNVCGANPSATAGGSFNLTGTQYENTCRETQGGPNPVCTPSMRGPCTVLKPRLRFWEYDDYGRANFGCRFWVERCWLANWKLDLNAPNPDGRWRMQSVDWFSGANPHGVDGCYVGGTPRTVAEVSDVFPPVEGSIDHSSWYLVAAVEYDGRFLFDRIKGGDVPAAAGCAPPDVSAHPVSAVRIAGRDPAACIGNTTPTEITTTGGFLDVTVEIADPTPPYYTEAGRHDPAARLLDGYRIFYKVGAEPTTSDRQAGGWLPALDPATSQVLGTLAYGTRQRSVRVPVSGGQFIWFAARLVYADCSLNGSKVADPSCSPTSPFYNANDPVLGTQLGQHCGPVQGI